MAAEVRRIVTSGFYPLYIAAMNGRTGIVERLLRVEGVDVNRGVPGDGATPLFIACQHGHTSVVRKLLNESCDATVGMRDNGWSPLFVASWSGHADVVKELLAYSADPTILMTAEHLEVPAGSTALSVAELKGHKNVVAVLNGDS